MKVLKLQFKGVNGWQSKKEGFLSNQEGISLITDRGNKAIKEEIDRGDTGFCHRRFKANIVLYTGGMVEVGTMQPGDHLRGTEVELQIQKVGKKCHRDCPIYSKAGCSLLGEILFLEVEKPGKIALGEEVIYREKD